MRILVASLLVALVLASPAAAAAPTASALLLEPPAIVWGELLSSTAAAPSEVVSVVVDDAAGDPPDPVTAEVARRGDRTVWTARVPSWVQAPARKGGRGGASTVRVKVDGALASPSPADATFSFDNGRLLRLDVKDGTTVFEPRDELLSFEARLRDAAGGQPAAVVLRALARKAEGSTATRLRFAQLASTGESPRATAEVTPTGATFHVEHVLSVPSGSTVEAYAGRWLAYLTPFEGTGAGRRRLSTTSRTTNAVRVERRFVSHAGLESGAPEPAAPTADTTGSTTLQVTPSLADSAFAEPGAARVKAYRVTGTASGTGAQGPRVVGLVSGGTTAVEDGWLLRVAGFARAGAGVGLLAGSRLRVTLGHTVAGALRTTVLVYPLDRCRTTPAAEGSTAGSWWQGETFLGTEEGLEGGTLKAVELVLEGRGLAGDFALTVDELTLASPVEAAASY